MPSPRKPAIVDLLREEFRGYGQVAARRDAIAGLTVAAVALPLALAFGVASGSTPAAGLVTAIIGGFLIGLLGGAPYQISGPTGAMSAVLITIANQQGMRGLWIAGVMAGLLILAIGILRMGRIVDLIPAPVITGFTSGIALVIFIGQIDNFLGISTPSEERSIMKVAGYFRHPLPPIDWQAVGCGLVVILTMLLLPRVRPVRGIPAALVGIALATGIAWALGWGTTTIGTIPRSIVLEDRLIPNRSDLDLVPQLVVPALAIGMLGSIESLLCGIVGGRMTGRKLAVNQELIAQGIGNIALPFFGGVPATAAIARTSVGVKAGGVTRMVSVVHSATLLVGALFFGALLGHIPMSALAGVLFVTAWRMNEWHSIRYYREHRLTGAIAAFLTTMIATVALDLTQAIVVGLGLSLVLFLRQAARLEVTAAPVRWSETGIVWRQPPDAQVIYVTGPLFFGSVNKLVERLEALPFSKTLILSMRGVPMADVSSVQAIEHLWREHVKAGGTIYLAGLQPAVRKMFDDAGLVAEIGEQHIFWSANQAIERLAELNRLAESETSPQEPPAESLDELPLGISVV
ncbi:MAG: SulP family inorganic anion transporter [Thermomicrobiales bacterium]|nr:SulP family inorganic anion transporter [Thermomicrobiales bacterium]